MATFYVATDGSDSRTYSQAQNISTPWRTFQRAVTDASPGDTVYFRGGTYLIDTSINVGNDLMAIYITRDGTAANPINYYNYPNEIPVFDCSLIENPYESRNINGIYVGTASYINFRGLTVANTWHINPSNGRAVGISLNNSHHITLDRCVVHDSAGRGFMAYKCYAIDYINCDAYWCADPQLQDPGNAGTGYLADNQYTDVSNGIITFTGCRAWRCSDQGWGAGGGVLTIIDKCWSFWNGIHPTYWYGGGFGFKLGYTYYDIDPIQTIVRNSIAAANVGAGFHENTTSTGLKMNLRIYNNLSYYSGRLYYSGAGIGFLTTYYGTEAGHPEADYTLTNQNIYRNNISYDNSSYDMQIQQDASHMYNSFDRPYTPASYSIPSYYKSPSTVNASDFVSLDWTQLLRDRKPDGSLPDVSFGHLRAGSDLIYIGIEVDSCIFDAEGNPRHNPPSLGPYEYSGNIYYVDPNGNDASLGTISQPWQTLDGVFTKLETGVVVAGDTVYFRGGVYYLPNGYAQCYRVKGTSTNEINLFNYPGEVPIFDRNNDTSSGQVAVSFGQCDYFYLKGLTFRNVWQPYHGERVTGVAFVDCSSFTVEQCNVYNVHGTGFENINVCRNFRYINCDAYNCNDSLTDPSTDLPGNDGQGFACDTGAVSNVSAAQATVYYDGCRAWDCGDQGFVSNYRGYTEYYNCWAFHNGLLQGTGSGFKLGYMWGTSPTDLSVNRKIVNSIAAHNRAYGFWTNEDTARPLYGLQAYNNFAYHQGYFNDPSNLFSGRGFWINDASATTAEEKSKRFIYNNIAYDNEYRNFYLDANASCTDLYNSWNLNATLRDADFINLDVSQLFRPRKSNGDLPDVSFGHLSADASRLIYAGMYLDGSIIYDAEGKLWNNPPSIGAYEYDVSTSIPTVTTSSAINILITSASCGGIVTHDGSIALTYRGICISTNINPTTLDTSVRDSITGEGNYTLSLTGLNASTHYHVRAFAYNSQGTSYGIDVSFNTLLYSSYYIGPSGSDTSGNGTRGNPWFGVGYAINQCSPGDTVYALDGSYNYDSQQTISVSGTAGNYITLTSESRHPDSVIFDFWNYDDTGSAAGHSIYGIYAINRSYLKFERFRLRRLWKINTDQGRAHGMYFQNCNHIDFEWIVIDNIAGRGIQGYNSGTANITNCDFTWCADPQLTDPGNAGTGIIWYSLTDNPSDTLRITGCRFWQNADQGLETMTGNTVIIDRIWSWDNDLHDEGYTSGTGNGIKPSLGFNSDLPITVTNSIFAFNRIGVNENTTSGGYKFNFNFFNNVVYANLGIGVLATYYPSGGTSRENIYRNNISFDNGSYDMQIQQDASHMYNSFDRPYTPASYSIPSYYYSPATVSTSDFIAIPISKAECTSILGATRNADGSLPDIGDYFKLAAGSDLIGIGTWVDVSLDGEGKAWNNPPSLGAFEYDGSTADPSTSIPTVTTSSISSITSSTATGGGNVTHDGSISLTYRGICWSTSASPTTLNASTLDATTGEGAYTSYLTSLSASTHYYVRAFAYNSQGTSYGIDVSFNTLAATASAGSSGKAILVANKFIKINGKIIKF